MKKKDQLDYTKKICLKKDTIQKFKLPTINLENICNKYM